MPVLGVGACVLHPTIRLLTRIPRAWQSAVQAGMQAAASGEFETALRAFSAALGCVPCDASTAYNAACCYARSGDEDNAITWITNAAQYGFDAFKHAQKDDDLKLIHEHAEFAKAVERMAVNKEINTAIRSASWCRGSRLAGTATMPVVARVVTVPTDDSHARCVWLCVAVAVAVCVCAPQR